MRSHLNILNYFVNSVQSSSNTGGQTGSAGSNGLDGADGLPGRDGQPGGNGGSVISSHSNASIHIESDINGEKIVETFETYTQGEGAIAVVDTIAVSTDPDTDLDLTTPDDLILPANAISASDEEVVRDLQYVLSSIRLMLHTYVGIFF